MKHETKFKLGDKVILFSAFKPNKSYTINGIVKDNNDFKYWLTTGSWVRASNIKLERN